VAGSSSDSGWNSSGICSSGTMMPGQQHRGQEQQLRPQHGDPAVGRHDADQRAEPDVGGRRHDQDERERPARLPTGGVEQQRGGQAMIAPTTIRWTTVVAIGTPNTAPVGTPLMR
jgi:hypothetical protein